MAATRTEELALVAWYRQLDRRNCLLKVRRVLRKQSPVSSNPGMARVQKNSRELTDPINGGTTPVTVTRGLSSADFAV